METNIGGERLGSGGKMTTNLRTYSRSNHNLNTIVRTTMAAGTLVPCLSIVGLPGDTIDIDLDIDVMTHPTIGPLFGSYKVQLDVFTIPVRLYNAKLHNNALNIGLNMAQIKLPYMVVRGLRIDETKPIDNQQMNPSCILKYLGISGIGQKGNGWATDAVAREFNAIPYLGYWDIYKNYYANKQEEIGAVIHSNVVASAQTINGMNIMDIATNTNVAVIDDTGNSGFDTGDGTAYKIRVGWTGTEPDWSQIIIETDLGEYALTNLFSNIVVVDNDEKDFTGALSGGVWMRWRYATGNDTATIEPQVYTFPLANIDQMRMDILAAANQNTAFRINQNSIEPYKLPLSFTGESTPAMRFNSMNSQEGLAIKTYQSDVFNNWIDTEWIDGTNGISATTAVSTAGDKFTVDALNLASKLYTLLNRVALSDGTYKSWIETVYTHGGYWRAETPSYVGGLSKELVFQEVISNAASENQPLGTLAGRGRLNGKHKGGKVVIKPDEVVYIMGIISLTPRIDYSQGNTWDMNLRTMDDFHKPQLDGIGYQDLITDQMAWWETTVNLGNTVENVYRSAGKQPAWINYMTNVNRTYGNFAVTDNEMFMTLNRRYEYDANTNRIKDLTTYIDPVKFNQIFAETARDAQNFWVQIGMDITARRVMSAKIIPNL
jgi:hypothetical protein